MEDAAWKPFAPRRARACARSCCVAPDEYNTITPALRDELAAAIDAADADREVHAILLRAEGPAFCAGYGLDWSTAAQAREGARSEASRAQLGGTRLGLGLRHAHDRRFVDIYMKLWYAKKPTHRGGAGLVHRRRHRHGAVRRPDRGGRGRELRLPAARVWGTPTTAMWVYRMGLEKAKRYLLTGDEIPARKAAEIGLILEVGAGRRARGSTPSRSRARIARVPTNQLVMLKLLCNQTVENMGFASSRALGTLFDGIARHTQEGLDFVRRAGEVGFRQAVRERDDPFGDYGSRKR